MMNTFIKELRQRFYEDRHIFYFINQCPLSEKSLFDYGDVFEMTGKNAREKAMHLKKYADMSDYIIWHGMERAIHTGRCGGSKSLSIGA